MFILVVITSYAIILNVWVFFRLHFLGRPHPVLLMLKGARKKFFYICFFLHHFLFILSKWKFLSLNWRENIFFRFYTRIKKQHLMAQGRSRSSPKVMGPLKNPHKFPNLNVSYGATASWPHHRYQNSCFFPFLRDFYTIMFSIC